MKPSETAAHLPTRPPHFELFPVLDRTWPANGLGPVAVIVAQLPDPATVPAGEIVVIRDSGRPLRGLRRFARGVQSLWRKPPKAHPAIRCTALLARGYREISARTDPRSGESLVWGIAPTSGQSSSEP